jgi:hypothetical protein
MCDSLPTPWKPLPGNILRCSLRAYWIPHKKTEKHNSKLQSNTCSRGGVEHWMKVGQGVKLSGNEGGKSNTGWEQGWGDKPTSQRSQTSTKKRWDKAQRLREGWGDKQAHKIRASGGSLSWSYRTESSTQNGIAPPCWGRSQQDSFSCRATQLPPGENNSEHLQELAVSYLRPQLQPSLWTEGIYYSQVSDLVRPHQRSHL